MKNPYININNRQLWKSGVANSSVFNVENLYFKKFEISQTDKIATAGSCFAQHLSKRLMKVGYCFMNTETPPKFLPEDCWSKFGYNIYSARFGNIYTVKQLLELAEEALGIIPTMRNAWIKNEGYFDPLRPTVEPHGLSNNEEYLLHRKFHLQKVKKLLTDMDIFVFTLGLTEYWQCNESGRALPTAPGVVAGDYDKDKYSFKNMTCSEVVRDFTRFMDLVSEIKGGKECKYLLTVSPVPLAATAENEHVLPATTYSKSTLRSAAGELKALYDNVDYFPSYEIISAPWSRGVFYDTDQRNVLAIGVDTVMRVFFQQHPPFSPIGGSSDLSEALSESIYASTGPDDDEVVCDEALLEGFSK